jgi:polyisoprenoid-binding protein YceI
MFVVDMTTITVLDLSGGSKEKLEGHLKSDDFFGSEAYPEAKMVITNVKSTGSNQYDITGELTIKGITNPVNFTATTADEDGLMVASAEIVIDRSKYNVRYGSPTFFNNIGDKAIYDEFTLNVKVVAN